MRKLLREIPLGRKLLLAMMVTSSVALLVACSFFLGYDFIRFRQDMTQHLASVGEIIGANSTAALTFNDQRSAALVLNALKSEPHILAANVYDADGAVFVSYRRDASVTVALPERSPVPGSRMEPDHLTECSAILLDQESIGSVCLQSDLQEIRSRAMRYLTFVFVFWFTSIVAAFMVALLLKRFVSRPILDLIRTTKIVSKERNYGIRAVRYADDEFGLLVEGFNEMLSEIEKRDTELKNQVEARTRMNLELTKAKESAEAANRAKSEFLANMSHEIRSPMNGVIGMTELALATEVTAEQRGYLQTVQSSARSLMSVINDILDFSKIEAEKLRLNVAEMNLDDLMAEVLKSFAVRAHQKGLELMYEIGKDVPSTLCSDAERLRQVLVNLIGNALKFTDKGEVVTRVKVESRSANKVILHFSVEDTGIGIPLNKQTMIFDAFAQADGSHSRKYGGTGLGLTISRRIIEMLAGAMWVESQPGKGSAFHFRIPSEGIDRPQAWEADARMKQLLGVRALIVDDNATNCRILQGVLRTWRMLPWVANDARTALRLLENSAHASFPFQLLLVDADMPGTDGFELVRSLRKLSISNPGVIVMLSSNGLHGALARCRELQLPHHVEKPVRRSELLQSILGIWEKPRASQSVSRSLNKASHSLHILLAEDSPVNQELVFKILLMQGHSVEVAFNGNQAVAAVQSDQFDVVLMDVQMPEMDGLEATAEIRRQEQTIGSHVPIIALTAHAMRGDRERCLAAGMDGYLQKPFYPADLHKALAPYCERAGAFSAMDASGSPKVDAKENGKESEVLNLAEALARAGGSEKLMRRVLQVFLDNSPAMWAEIQAAVANRDSAAIQHSAHTLKGSASLIGAQLTTQAARELEMIAKSGELDAAAAALDQVEHELRRLTTAVANLGEAASA